jgi:hypothetical protein
MLRVWAVAALFLVGLAFSSRVTSREAFGAFMGTAKEAVEGFEGRPASDICPNLLIKKDGKLILKNTNKAEVPGVNPIEFANVGEYEEYMEWLRSQGIRCPVLYLEYGRNAQGQNGYRVLRDFDDHGTLLPITDSLDARLPEQRLLMDAGYTGNGFPGFDPANQYQGFETPLDALHNVQKRYAISDNPMDTNWGGPEVTRAAIARGKYGTPDVSQRKTAIDLALESQGGARGKSK